MKIQNINTSVLNSYSYKYKMPHGRKEMHADFSSLRNQVSFSSNNRKNDITVKEPEKGGIYRSFDFYDGDKLVGKARLTSINQAQYGDFPDSWYLEERKNIDEKIKTKPICKVVTLVMEDKIGMSEYTDRPNGKKYGTMCMQKILEWANSNGYDDRITLNPAQLDSFVSPSQFYAKLGFELSPKQKEVRTKQLEDLSQKTDDYSKLKLFYALKNIECGRFLAFPGDNVNLVHPEILRNYPVYR